MTAGLADLGHLELLPQHAHVLGEMAAQSLGGKVWRDRKLAEAHELIALSQIAPRMRIHAMDLRTDLVAVVLLQLPVPCKAPGAATPHIERGALLAIRYEEELLRTPIAGTRPIRLLQPQRVYHSNVGPEGDPRPALCLGASIPRGLPAKEMVLQSHAALTLQSISLDDFDPAGVLNPEAARYWQTHADQIPLSREPFLGNRP